MEGVRSQSSRRRTWAAPLAAGFFPMAAACPRLPFLCCDPVVCWEDDGGGVLEPLCMMVSRAVADQPTHAANQCPHDPTALAAAILGCWLPNESSSQSSVRRWDKERRQGG